VSGLNLGSSSSDQFSIETMVDYVTGQLGGAKVGVVCCCQASYLLGLTFFIRGFSCEDLLPNIHVVVELALVHLE